MAEYAQASRGYVGFGTQASAQGTGVAATRFQTVTDVSLKENRPGASIYKGIRRQQDMNLALRGGIDLSGSIKGYLIPDEAFGGIVFAHLLGNNNTVSGSGPYTHTFSQSRVGTAADMPSYGSTIEVLLGSTDNTLLRDMVGCFLKKLTLSSDSQDAAVLVDTEWVGTKQVDGDTNSSPTYSTKSPFEGWMASIELGSAIGSTAAVEAKKFNFSVDNGVSVTKTLNGRYPIGRVYGDLAATLSFEQDLKESLTIYNYFKNETEIAAKLILTHDAIAGGSTPYSLTVNLPRLRMLGDPPSLSGSAEIPFTINLQALYDSVTSKTLDIVVVNSQSGTYAV